MKLNDKELKKTIYSFKNISNQIMNAYWKEYNIVLNKFLFFIDNNEIIKNYINKGYNPEFKAKCEYRGVAESQGILMFKFDPIPEKESYQVYQILKYILETNSEVYFDMASQYNHLTDVQEILNAFNNSVLLILINNINEYLIKEGIDMGIDENLMFNIQNNGQLNIANDNGIVNSIQNNNIEINENELDILIKNIMDNLSEISSNDAETIKDSVEMIKEELKQQNPKSNTIKNGIKLLAPIITIANGTPVLADNIQKFINFVSQYIN